MSTVSENNDAKLELAADLELQAKFQYQGEGDFAPRERRVVVEEFDGEYVEGVSYDANSQSEGYRRFRLDRIEGKVAIR